MFLIRADGNANIGAGHLMRCLAIAEEMALLQGGGENIRFVCADEQSAALVRGHGFQSLSLGTDYRDMESELPLWQDMAEELSGPEAGRGLVILADSYYVTDSYLAALKQWGYVILMDDLGAHCHPADLVVNYNAPASLEAYEKLYSGRNVRLLVGSSYVPLRRQFWDGRYAFREKVSKVLITTGGGDVENIAGAILDRIYVPDLSFYLVIGQFNPHFRKMKELERERENVHICHNVADMAGLMRDCDIALTAGGSTVYELAAVGVPMICFSYAENQEALAEYMEAGDIACSAGAWHKDPERTLEAVSELFGRLARDEAMRASYHKKEMAMIDARGAGRLARVFASIA